MPKVTAPPAVEEVLLMRREFVPVPRSTLPLASPPLRVTESSPVPPVYEPMKEVEPVIERLLVPSPELTAPVTEPPLMVTVSLPLPEEREPMAPAPDAMVKVLVPAPRLRLPVRAPVEATVVVSEPEPRAIFSRLEKLIEPRVPASPPEIFRL